MQVLAVLMSPWIEKGGKFGRFMPNLLERVAARKQTPASLILSGRLSHLQSAP
jgi:hypothetical protein